MLNFYLNKKLFYYVVSFKQSKHSIFSSKRQLLGIRNLNFHNFFILWHPNSFLRKKYKDRGRSGREQMEKELAVIRKAEYKDIDLTEEYGKDAYKAKSVGTRKFSQGGLVYGKKFSGIY